MKGEFFSFRKMQNLIYPAKDLDVLVQDHSQSVVPEPSMPFAVYPLSQQIIEHVDRCVVLLPLSKRI